MGQAIAVRTDFTAGEVRRFAKRAKDAAQARRLLAIAAVLDGALREEAAKVGGMDRQTLRDWVIRFNEQGPDGLINIPSPGVPPKLGQEAPGVSSPARGGGPDRSGSWRGTLASVGSNDAVARGVRPIGVARVTAGAHAILILDQAGWHGAKDLKIPSNLSLLPLPPRAPELNSQENIWQFMRQNWLSNRIFKSFDDIVDHCCYAWNILIDQPWKIMSIARREWAVVGQPI